MRSCENGKKIVFGHLSNKHNTNIVDMMCSCENDQKFTFGYFSNKFN